MIVVTSKLQREISYLGLAMLKKLAVDTSGNLKRMDLPPGPADALVGTVVYLKDELDRVPSHEQGSAGVEVEPHAAKSWRTALVAYVRKANRIDHEARQLTMQTNVNDRDDAALKLINQLNEQLELPVESLEAIVAAEARRSTNGDAESADASDRRQR